MSAKKSNRHFLLLMLGLAVVSALALFGGILATIVSEIFMNLDGGVPPALPIPFEHYRIAGGVNIICGLLGLIGALGLFKRAKWGRALALVTTTALWLNGTTLGAHILAFTPAVKLPPPLQFHKVLMGSFSIIIITVICGGLAWLSLRNEVFSEFGE